MNNEKEIKGEKTTLVFPDANGFVKAMEQFVDVVEREQVLYHHLLH